MYMYTTPTFTVEAVLSEGVSLVTEALDAGVGVGGHLTPLAAVECVATLLDSHWEEYTR